MKIIRKVGVTSQILQIFIADSSSTTGAGLTGLAFNSASLTAYYHRDTDTTATAITLVTMTVGTFTSSGFKEIDATNMPGWYQFCPPNAALASGAASVSFHLKGATNMAPLPIEVDLDAQVDVTFWNGTVVATPATAGIPDVNTKNLGNTAQTGRDIGASVLLSSLDSPVINTGTAQSGTSSGIVIQASGTSAVNSFYNSLEISLISGTGAGQTRVITSYNGTTKAVGLDENWQTAPDNTTVYRITFVRAPWIDSLGRIAASSTAALTGNVTVATNLDKTGYSLSAAGVQAVWDALTSALTTVGSIGKLIVDNLNATITSVKALLPAALVSGRMDSSVGAYQSGQAPLQPTTAGRTLDVSTGGEAGLDWANIGSPTTTVGLTGTTISTSQVVASVTAGVTLTAGAIQAIWDALTSALTTVGSIGKRLADNIDAAITTRTKPADTQAAVTLVTTTTNLTNAPTAGDFTATMKTSLNAATPAVTVSDKTGFSLSAAGIQAIWDALTSALTTVGSIGKRLADDIDATISSRSTFAGGAVSSVTGNVGGNVVGSVGSLTSTAVQNIWDALTSGLTTVGSIGKLLAALPGSIWDVVISGHTTAGTTGAALNTAGSATDPWGVALPGAYGAGTAGKILGTNLDTTVSSRSTFAGGAVASVTAAVDITQAAADKVLGTSAAALPELASVPSATPRPAQLLMLIYQSLRSKLTVTSSSKTLFNDAGTALGSKALADDGTTYTESKLA